MFVSRSMFWIYMILVSWKIAESVSLNSHHRTPRQIGPWDPGFGFPPPPPGPGFGDPSMFGDVFNPDFNVGPFSNNPRPGNNFGPPRSSPSIRQPSNGRNNLNFQGSNNDFGRPLSGQNNNRRPFDGSGNDNSGRRPFTNPNRRPQPSDGSGNIGRQPFNNPNRRPQSFDGSGNGGRRPFTNSNNRRPQSFDGSGNGGRRPFTNSNNRRPQTFDGSGTGGFNGNMNFPTDTTTTENPLSTLPVPGAATRPSPCEQACQATGEFDPVCGNNRVTYSNLGRFNCAVDCLQGMLQMAHRGMCRT
ncbi:uncharacterized protein LOC114338257 [Diabrotica virgifera virgifera]|uniref:Kazal-like domain-containing protein n=1 Tax=Diabrotica virgifera virgifera TaxID=50390 RepID=A0ABM5IW06_DIAVI|nr:uncharacterized protein LOC114338257 [Diabrotica virgifera virgifera]